MVAVSRVYRLNSVFATVQGEGSQAGRAAVFVRLAGCNLWSGALADDARDKQAAEKGACARWCDTDFSGQRRLTAEEIASEVRACMEKAKMRDGGGIIVVTGGEPLLQLDEPLAAHLAFTGAESVWVETNGTRPRPTQGPSRLHYTLSPKRGPKAVLDRSWFNMSTDERRRCELKVVVPGVANGSTDGWTEDALLEMAAAVDPAACFLQPQDVIDPSTVGRTLLSGNLPVLRDDDETRVRGLFAQRVAWCVDFVHRHPEWRISTQTHKVLNVP